MLEAYIHDLFQRTQWQASKPPVFTLRNRNFSDKEVIIGSIAEWKQNINTSSIRRLNLLVLIIKMLILSRLPFHSHVIRYPMHASSVHYLYDITSERGIRQTHTSIMAIFKRYFAGETLVIAKRHNSTICMMHPLRLDCDALTVMTNNPRLEEVANMHGY